MMKAKKVNTNQFKVSGEIVFKLPLCFAQVLQLAFSNLTPFAISDLCLVVAFQLEDLERRRKKGRVSKRCNFSPDNLHKILRIIEIEKRIAFPGNFKSSRLKSKQ